MAFVVPWTHFLEHSQIWFSLVSQSDFFRISPITEIQSMVLDYKAPVSSDSTEATRDCFGPNAPQAMTRSHLMISA